MPQLDVYLTFDGNCAEAMRFYERTLGGKLETLMTFGESPMADQCPAGAEDRVMHARLNLGDRALMASDAMVDQPYEGMKNVSLTLLYSTVAEAERIFGVLAEGGQITMPFQKTFWSQGFGMVVDRFGTPWMVNGPEAGGGA